MSPPLTRYFQGVPTDWTSRHIVFSKPEPGSDAEDKVQQDRRYWLQQIRRAQLADEDFVAEHKKKKPAKTPKPKPLPKSHKDWAFSLGNGTVSLENMLPAKFSFNTGSGTLTSANCTSDFGVYGLNVAGATAGRGEPGCARQSLLGDQPHRTMRHRAYRLVGLQRNHPYWRDRYDVASALFGRQGNPIRRELQRRVGPSYLAMELG